MPLYEFLCEECRLHFEVGTNRDIPLEGMICIDCASAKVKILTCDTDSYSRLAKIMSDIKDLQERIELISEPENYEEPN